MIIFRIWPEKIILTDKNAHKYLLLILFWSCSSCCCQMYAARTVRCRRNSNNLRRFTIFWPIFLCKRKQQTQNLPSKRMRQWHHADHVVLETAAHSISFPGLAAKKITYNWHWSWTMFTEFMIQQLNERWIFLNKCNLLSNNKAAVIQIFNEICCSKTVVSVASVIHKIRFVDL